MLWRFWLVNILSYRYITYSGKEKKKKKISFSFFFMVHFLMPWTFSGLGRDKTDS